MTQRKGRYATIQQAKNAARKHAPHLDWGQTVEVIRFDDGSFDWMVNTSPLPMPQDRVSVASFSRINRRWVNYVSEPRFIDEI